MEFSKVSRGLPVLRETGRLATVAKTQRRHQAVIAETFEISSIKRNEKYPRTNTLALLVLQSGIQ
jgi:hypothetical protein